MSQIAIITITTFTALTSNKSQSVNANVSALQMYVDASDQLLGNWTEITVSVWEQRQYDAPLVGRQASQDRERQQSVAAHSVWEVLYVCSELTMLLFSVWWNS